MAIQSGTHLGPYEILSAIGAGQKYRAMLNFQLQALSFAEISAICPAAKGRSAGTPFMRGCHAQNGRLS